VAELLPGLTGIPLLGGQEGDRAVRLPSGRCRILESEVRKILEGGSSCNQVIQGSSRGAERPGRSMLRSEEGSARRDYEPRHPPPNRKGRLKFRAGDGRRLRNSLPKDWNYSKHYVDSAINSAIGLAKGWIKLYNKGAKSKPKATGKTVYVKSTLFTFRDGKLKSASNQTNNTWK